MKPVNLYKKRKQRHRAGGNLYINATIEFHRQIACENVGVNEYIPTNCPRCNALLARYAFRSKDGVEIATQHCNTCGDIVIKGEK